MSNLKDESEAAIRTTMVGAIESIENNFGHLWNHGALPVTEQQKEFLEVFTQVRKEIFGKGNDQIRNIGPKFSEYKISRKVTSIDIPCVKK